MNPTASAEAQTALPEARTLKLSVSVKASSSAFEARYELSDEGPEGRSYLLGSVMAPTIGGIADDLAGVMREQTLGLLDVSFTHDASCVPEVIELIRAEIQRRQPQRAAKKGGQ